MRSTLAFGLLTVLLLPAVSLWNNDEAAAPATQSPSPEQMAIRIRVLFESEPHNPDSKQPLIQKCRAAFGRWGFTDAIQAEKRWLPVVTFEDTIRGVNSWKNPKIAQAKLREKLAGLDAEQVNQYHSKISTDAALVVIDYGITDAASPEETVFLVDVSTVDTQVDGLMLKLQVPQPEHPITRDPLLTTDVAPIEVLKGNSSFGNALLMACLTSSLIILIWQYAGRLLRRFARFAHRPRRRRVTA